MRQKTIKRPISISGVALHSGVLTKIVFQPEEPDSGIVFVRRDLKSHPKVPAIVKNVIQTKRGVTLKHGRAKVMVPEHVLAALYGLGIDNCRIELAGIEPPNLDGSSSPYVKLLERAGIVEQNAPKRWLEILRPVAIKKGEARIEAKPYSRLKITFMVDYKNTVVGREKRTFEGGFKRSIAPARTFGFWEEIESLWKSGLALGGTLKNTLVIKKDEYVTKPRFKDEVVRHKILDLIGDLALIGQPIKAHIIAKASGHELNIKLARRLKWQK